MNRSDAIAAINVVLDGLDDQHLAKITDVVVRLGEAPIQPIRDLTVREAALLEASKNDFLTGQTLTLEESEADIAAMLADIDTDTGTPLAS